MEFFISIVFGRKLAVDPNDIALLKNETARQSERRR